MNGFMMVGHNCTLALAVTVVADETLLVDTPNSKVVFQQGRLLFIIRSLILSWLCLAHQSVPANPRYYSVNSKLCTVDYW